MMETDTVITIAIVLLLVLFNIYFSNVITSQSDVPEHPSYPFECNSSEKGSEECKMKIKEYEETKKVIEKYSFNFNISLLILGILNVVLYMLMDNGLNLGFGIAGIITILYATILNWSRYNDKVKLGIVTVGLFSIWIAFNKFKFISN